MQLLETLEKIVFNIQMDFSEFHISYSDMLSIESPTNSIAQLKKTPKEIQYEYFKYQLFKLLNSIYFEGSLVIDSNTGIKENEQLIKEVAAKEVDWEFYEKLDKSNQGKGWFHPSFHIRREENDVSLIAEFDNGILYLQRDRHLPLFMQSATVNDPIAIFLPSSFINKDRYMANGEGFGGFPPSQPFRYVMIIYFNFSPEAAISAMRCITTRLNAAKLPFRFEVLHNPLNYNVYNSGILKVFSYEYELHQYKEFILPTLQTIYKENKFSFREEVPIFTKVLAPGIGLAERPHAELKLRYQGDSEGNYCELVANALLEAHQNGDESPEARMKYILQHFEHLGIDLERPYLNPNSEDIYTPLN